MGECWNCSPPSMTHGATDLGGAAGGIIAGSGILLGYVFSWKSIGCSVSSVMPSLVHSIFSYYLYT